MQRRRGWQQILVVEDDPLVLAQTAAMLEDLGYSVIRAASGEEAFVVLRSDNAVDLLLTDYLMLGMTGIQLAGIAGTEKPSLPILLKSAFC